MSRKFSSRHKEKSTPHRDFSSVRQVLRNELVASGMTLGALAAKIACSESMLSGLLSGARSLDLEWIARICAGLNITPEKILEKSLTTEIIQAKIGSISAEEAAVLSKVLYVLRTPGIARDALLLNVDAYSESINTAEKKT